MIGSILATMLLVSTSSGEPAVGAKAPDFSLPDQDGKTWTLSEQKSATTVLVFYPKAFTGG